MIPHLYILQSDHHTELKMFFPVMRTCNIYSLSNFRIFNTVLLTIVAIAAQVLFLTKTLCLGVMNSEAIKIVANLFPLFTKGYYEAHCLCVFLLYISYLIVPTLSSSIKIVEIIKIPNFDCLFCAFALEILLESSKHYKIHNIVYVHTCVGLFNLSQNRICKYWKYYSNPEFLFILYLISYIL